MGLGLLACILALFAHAWELAPLLQASLLHVCTCKDKRNKLVDKRNKLVDKQRNKLKEKYAKDKLEKDNKQGQTNMWSTWRGKQTYYQTKGGVLGGQM